MRVNTMPPRQTASPATSATPPGHRAPATCWSVLYSWPEPLCGSPRSRTPIPPSAIATSPASIFFAPHISVAALRCPSYLPAATKHPHTQGARSQRFRGRGTALPANKTMRPTRYGGRPLLSMPEPAMEMPVADPKFSLATNRAAR